MFILSVSNFLGAFFESLFYFHYKNLNDNCIKESSTKEECNEVFIKINDSQICKLIGLSHNFFDLYSVCWTAMLTLLFYLSTNKSGEMTFDTKKYLIIGFIYSTFLSFILMIIPFISGDNFGFSRFYCSYRYYHYVDINGNTGERNETKGWRYSLFVVLFLNLIFDLFCLIKTYRFYSDKLNTLKQQDKFEYKSLIIFVWVFRLYPIVIIITRSYRVIARVIVEVVNKATKENEESSTNIIEYINGFIYSSNGIIISLASILFFRGIFTCCSSETIKEKINNDDKIDMRFLEDEND
jgi:hypothetical protein